MATQKKTDTVKATVSLSALEKEVTKVEPYVVAVGNSKVITFPSPLDMPWQDSVAFMDGMDSDKPMQILETWLSEDDLELLKEANPSLAVLMKVLQGASEHYSEVMGDPKAEVN